MGISFSAFSPISIRTFVLLECKHHIKPGWPQCYVCSLRDFTEAWGVRVSPMPASADRRNPLAMSDWCPLLKLILFCLFSVWIKHCSVQCLTLLFSSESLWYQDVMSRVFGVLQGTGNCAVLDSRLFLYVEENLKKENGVLKIQRTD